MYRFSYDDTHIEWSQKVRNLCTQSVRLFEGIIERWVEAKFMTARLQMGIYLYCFCIFYANGLLDWWN